MRSNLWKWGWTKMFSVAPRSRWRSWRRIMRSFKSITWMMNCHRKWGKFKNSSMRKLWIGRGVTVLPKTPIWTLWMRSIKWLLIKLWTRQRCKAIILKIRTWSKKAQVGAEEVLEATNLQTQLLTAKAWKFLTQNNSSWAWSSQLRS